MEVNKPISARLVSVILFSVLELQFRARQLSQIHNAVFHVMLFAIFCKFTIVCQALKGVTMRVLEPLKANLAV